MEYSCAYCGKAFHAKRRWQRFCSRGCRWTAANERKEERQTLYSVCAAAQFLGLSRWTVRRAIQKGDLPAIEVSTGRRPTIVVRRDALERFEQRRTRSERFPPGAERAAQTSATPWHRHRLEQHGRSHAAGSPPLPKLGSPQPEKSKEREAEW